MKLCGILLRARAGGETVETAVPGIRIQHLLPTPFSCAAQLSTALQWEGRPGSVCDQDPSSCGSGGALAWDLEGEGRSTSCLPGSRGNNRVQRLAQRLGLSSPNLPSCSY